MASLSLNDKMKVDTLHKLLEGYGRQVQWVKDLDFKIIYYTLGLLVGVVAWFITNPPGKGIIFTLYGVITFLGLWSIILLCRNQKRHATLLDKLQLVHKALQLDLPNQYAPFALETCKNLKDWAFYAGRCIYAIGIAIACFLSGIILNSLLPHM